MTWYANAEETNSVCLIVDGSEVTTGTATIYYYRDNGGTIEYLQSDEATFGATKYEFSATHTADLGFNHQLEIPSAMQDFSVTWVMAHSVYGVIGTETHFVGGSEALTAANIADAVWDEQSAQHTSTGSFGKFFQDWNTQDDADHSEILTAILDETATIDADLSAIKGSGFDTSTDSLVKIRDEQVSRFDDVDADILAHRTADIAEHDVTQGLISGLNDPTSGEVADAVWDEARSAHTSTGSFGEALDGKVSTRASQTSVDDLQTDFDAFEVTNQAEHDATQALLNDATYGLSALNDDLDSILTRLGITTDTGGTNNAGTTMAKLNALIDAVGAISSGPGNHVDVKLRGGQ